MRPFLRLRRVQTCSAETRFQGIATSAGGRAEGCAAHFRLAVLRPVFRGLRRGEDRRELGRQPGPRLAVLRPVFRGLRRFLQPYAFHLIFNGHLAVLRPVFRGLRPGFLVPANEAGKQEACSAETRFQGIATRPPPQAAVGPVRPGPCSAETRFQGIATLHPAPGSESYPLLLQC